MLFTDKILTDDDYSTTGSSEVFLCTCVNNSESFPFDLSRSNVRAHIADNSHIFDKVPWEGSLLPIVPKLKTMDCLILTIMKV